MGSGFYILCIAKHWKYTAFLGSGLKGMQLYFLLKTTTALLNSHSFNLLWSNTRCSWGCSFLSLQQQNIVQYHHWREGNLPANSKCVACKKTCWSSECMAGMRCEWCGVTVSTKGGQGHSQAKVPHSRLLESQMYY